MTNFDSVAHPRSGDGTFTDKAHTAPELGLVRRARQAPPLEPVKTSQFNFPSEHYTQHPEDFDLNPPYQRGSVWTEDQRRALIRSMKLGLPIGAVTVNFRGHDVALSYAVIDGKQRIETIQAFQRDDFSVPRDWFSDDALVDVSHDNDHVFLSELSKRERMRFRDFPVLELRAEVSSVQAEAEIFTLLNGGGTAQTDESMARAADVEAS